MGDPDPGSGFAGMCGLGTPVAEKIVIGDNITITLLDGPQTLGLLVDVDTAEVS
jgi:hypothetical protein